MSMKVRLRGVWVRDDTTPYDISGFRHLFRDIAEENGVSGKFVAAHPENGSGTRRGSFDVVVVDVPSRGFHPSPKEQRQLVSRATRILKWFLQDATCRPPTIRVEKGTVAR